MNGFNMFVQTEHRPFLAAVLLQVETYRWNLSSRSYIAVLVKGHSIVWGPPPGDLGQKCLKAAKCMPFSDKN